MIKKAILGWAVLLLLGLTACTARANSTLPTPMILPTEPTPQNIIGGGTLQNGPFSFELRLFQDPTLNQHPVATSLYSDLNGFGEYMYWTYMDMDTIGPVETYWGTLPHYFDQLQQATYPSIGRGSNGGRTGGVLLPGGSFISGESKAGDRVRVALQVVTPNGKYGAMLEFTLKQGTNGFEPSDISIGILSN